ncbi:MAG: hypothetical protein JWM68_2570 [Verrucomicrobiales bacterium]|nr:hypothetical protein [Verrucomicrobiales bacterium]
MPTNSPNELCKETAAGRARHSLTAVRFNQLSSSDLRVVRWAGVERLDSPTPRRARSDAPYHHNAWKIARRQQRRPFFGSPLAPALDTSQAELYRHARDPPSPINLGLKISASSHVMTKRNMAGLLAPSIFFIFVAVLAFLISNAIREHSRDDGSQQKFDTFVSKVQSGEWQLPTDKWLERARLDRDLAESYRKTGNSTADVIHILMWMSLAGFVLQIAAVFSVRKKLRNLIAHNSVA